MTKARELVSPALLFVLAAFPALSAETPQRPINFDREIRPILSDNCFTCHGPDEKKRMANLRLDTPDGGAFSKRGSYQIIVPGDSKNSRLFQRVSASDKSSRMPPATSTTTLNQHQIDLLKQWIDQGAKWEVHWAFVAPTATTPPAINDPGARNAIDQFVRARLQKKSLKPSPEADKATLLRRVSYDLTGLPPTVAELNSFLADKAPDAYEKRVDALLNSPRYGERMTMQWLDLARYADTHGYHIDSHREMWHWRDWVVNAFNANMPYDQFTVEQLAGDLLPNATSAQKLASGFNRNHMINFEGGAIPEEYQVEYVVDRLEATSITWMGLTMGCARCHDHKYDPISQKEFYKFFAFFNTVNEKGLDGRNGNAEPIMQLPSDEQHARGEQLKKNIEAHKALLPETRIATEQTAWEQQELQRVPQPPRDGLVAHYELDGSLSDVSGHYQYARAVRGDLTYSNGAVGKAADFDGETEINFGHVPALESATPFSIAWWMRVDGKQRIAFLQQVSDVATRRGLEIYFDNFTLTAIQQRSPRMYVRLANAWPLNAIEVRTKDIIKPGDPMRHIVVNYDGSGKAEGIAIYVDGKPVTLETLKDSLAGPVTADAPMAVGSKLLDLAYKGKLDDLRIYSRKLTPAEVLNFYSQEPLRSTLNTLADKRSKQQKDWIRNYYLTRVAPEADQQAWQQLNALQAQQKQLEAAIPTTMVMSEMDKPRDTFVLQRGDYRNQTEKVTPGVPAVLPPLPAGVPADRLALAKWLVSPQNPLTARVAVNRFWQMYFGTGLVKTAENFGSQGEAPSHPELLDWLATEFVRSGWDVKAMQRLIVTSATYRQQSRVTPALEERDPENRLLARGPRFRLPAEMIRDGALYLSGLLNETRGGPGVNPYQPKGLWEEIAFGDGFSAQEYVQGHGADLYRRSMYTFWKRTSPPPEMITFDAPDREKCSARRLMTNTPLQALVLLNDPSYVEAARALAQRMVKETAANPDNAIRYGFRLATARQPAPAEVSILRSAYDAELVDFKKHEDQAAKLLQVGESPVDPKINKMELAAFTTVASMILNLDETITKE